MALHINLVQDRGEDGGYGYVLRDDQGRLIVSGDPVLTEEGVEIVEVAGTSFRLPALQGSAFAPGSRLFLRADPDNAYDENAVEVLDAGGRIQVGFVPRERAETIAQRLGVEPLEAWCLWAWRNESGRRSALRMLIAPPGIVAEEPRQLL